MGQPKPKTGLTDFLRREADLTTANPPAEIARLVKMAEGLGFSTKYLFAAFYQLRRQANGVKNTRSRKAVVKSEVVVDVPQASALSVLDSALATIRKEFEEMSQNLKKEKERAEKLEGENEMLRSQISRASHKYRFTWSVEDEALVMCNIFHRGDSLLHFKEV